jgi:hypothetical protein
LKPQASLLDVNALIALVDSEHMHHAVLLHILPELTRFGWGISAVSEAGALRILTNPRVGRYRLEEVVSTIEGLYALPRFRYWRETGAWREIPNEIRDRILGHQQITDAYLLAMAVSEGGVLVTFDKAIRHLAGERYKKHVVVLE